MEPIEFLNHAIPRTSRSRREIAPPASRAREHGENDFLATLLAMAGHDLRQPLQLIMSAHDVLATTRLSGGQSRELELAAQATARLTRMLGELVEAVQLQQHGGENLCAPVQLGPILEELAAEFEAPARAKRIALRVTSEGGTVFSHRVLLTGILRNLIRNAIDYTPSGGSVFVEAHRCGPELHIEVRDTGAGISANTFPRIFDAFERGDTSREDGLGLGLFIVKRGAQLLGHQVRVRSVEGQGSRFTLIARAKPLCWRTRSHPFVPRISAA